MASFELKIDVAGKVTDARVVSRVGNGFDEAALEAARRFVFEPAKRGDHPIPVRIKYRYSFEPAPEAPPTPTTGELAGKVLARGTNRVVVGAAITVVSEGDGAGQTTRTAITDEAGAFGFKNLPPGRRLIEKIDVYPGNFSARFGRKMGGIVDVGIRDPKTDGGADSMPIISTALGLIKASDNESPGRGWTGGLVT